MSMMFIRSWIAAIRSPRANSCGPWLPDSKPTKTTQAKKINNSWCLIPSMTLQVGSQQEQRMLECDHAVVLGCAMLGCQLRVENVEKHAVNLTELSCVDSANYWDKVAPPRFVNASKPKRQMLPPYSATSEHTQNRIPTARFHSIHGAS